MKANGYNQFTHSGEYGNASKRSSFVDGDIPEDEVVEFFLLKAGTTLYSLRGKADALGASTAMSFGWKYVDGQGTDDADGLIASGATTGTTDRLSSIHPIRFDRDVIITGTLTGGDGSGKVSAVAEYVWEGTE